jgi:hypothetical protein
MEQMSETETAHKVIDLMAALKESLKEPARESTRGGVPAGDTGEDAKGSAADDAPRSLAPATTHLIWSYEHGMWWRSDACGYTRDILQAGLYSQREAEDVEAQSSGRNEVAIPARLAYAIAKAEVCYPSHPMRAARLSFELGDGGLDADGKEAPHV